VKVGTALTNNSGEAQANIGTKGADVYEVTAVATYPLGGCHFTVETTAFIAVYNPNEGFVTGGGWIDSPAGAYDADPTLTGKATFGFVSKYLKGAKVPTGNTEFQFKAGGLNFKSTSYEWLVVAGAKAQYKGTGTVNGIPGYSFLLTMTDGQLPGGGGVDKFRIKIQNAGAGVVYDNRHGDTDDIASSDPQELGGGSIVIHRK